MQSFIVLLVLVVASSIVARSEVPSLGIENQSSITDKEQLQPIFVHPPPEDPDPGRNWDEQPDRTREFGSPSTCIVWLGDHAYFPPSLNRKDRICQTLLNQGPTYGHKDTEDIALITNDSVGNLTYRRAVLSASPTVVATITGHWVFKEENAHLAFKDYIVIRGSATSTVSKSAVITIPPTPLKVRKPVENVRVQTLPKSRSIYNDTICEWNEFHNLAQRENCIPIVAKITQPPSLSKLISWIYEFGPGGQHGAIRRASTSSEDLSHDSSSIFDVVDLPLFDIQSLLEFAKKHPETNEALAFNWFGCPKAPLRSNSDEIPILDKVVPSICFFSDGGYTREGLNTAEEQCEGAKKTHVVIARYSWWADTSDYKNILRKAITEVEADVKECVIKNDFPELLEAPAFLHPISGEVLTGSNGIPIVRGPVPRDMISPLAQAQEQANPGHSATSELGNVIQKESAEGIPGSQSPPAEAVQVNGEKKGGSNHVPASTFTIGSQEFEVIYPTASQPIVVFGSNTISLNAAIATVNLGSSKITAIRSEYTVAGHKFRLQGGSVVVDGMSKDSVPRPTVAGFRAASTGTSSFMVASMVNNDIDSASVSGLPSSDGFTKPTSASRGISPSTLPPHDPIAAPVPFPTAPSGKPSKSSSVAVTLLLSGLGFLLLATILSCIFLYYRLRRSRQLAARSAAASIAELDIGKGSIVQLDSQNIHEIAPGSIYEAASGRIASEISSGSTHVDLTGLLIRSESVSSGKSGSEASTVWEGSTDGFGSLSRKSID